MGAKVKLNELPEEYRKQAESQLHSSVCPAKQKQDRQDALVGKAEIPEFHAPCYLAITVYKTGANWDIDNRESKSVQDALVEAGILGADTISEIPKIIKQGIRVKTKAEECTEIELYEV